MPQSLYPEDHWKDVPKDFHYFDDQQDSVPYIYSFLSHLTARIGFSAGATLVDPASFARQMKIPDEYLPMITAFLERHGFILINMDGSLTLTERGEEWYGYTTEYHQQMLWSVDGPTWRAAVGNIRDARGYAEIAGKLNEHHAPLLRQFVRLLALEAVHDNSPEAIRLGILAAALAAAVANDGTRPMWIPSTREIAETLESLFHAAEKIGFDPANEFADIATMLTGAAKTLVGDFVKNV